MNDGATSAKDSSRVDSPWGTLVTMFAVLAGVLCAVLTISYFSQDQSQVSPPEVDFTGAPAEVTAAITHARSVVLMSTNSAEAWGQLAMMLRPRRVSRSGAPGPAPMK